jgi:prophage antirepressor-like protein
MQEFNINTYFNDTLRAGKDQQDGNKQRLRIINTAETPFFYADDLAKVLGITNLKYHIKDWDDFLIVSAEVRKQYGITTYRKYGNGFRENNKMILFTEPGAYKFILRVDNEKSNKFMRYVCDMLVDIRKEHSKTVSLEIIQENEALKEELVKKDAYIAKMKAEIKRYSSTTTLWVFYHEFEAGEDPYSLIPEARPRQVYDDDDGGWPGSDPFVLYKYTTRPDPADSPNMTQFGYLQGNPGAIFDKIIDLEYELDEESIDIIREARGNCCYTANISPKKIEKKSEGSVKFVEQHAPRP